MPVAGLLSLGRRAQHAIRLDSFSPGRIANTARRSFSNCSHVNSDYIAAAEQHAFPGDDSFLEIEQLPRINTCLDSPNPAGSEAPHFFLVSNLRPNSLQSILHRRLQLLSHNLALPPLTNQERTALNKLGYQDDHVRRYLDILTTPDSLSAARLLIQDDVPIFVHTRFLARRHIRPEALRLVLAHLSRWASITDDRSTHHLLPTFVALLRHCHRVWPAAIPLVAHFLTQNLRLSGNHQSVVHQDAIPGPSVARLSHHFNRALHYLAEPCRISPFKNVVFQEAAQALVLQHMAAHNPPLVINRTGYRAVTRVQLATNKTASEREWARLKSPSWPPWKEDRTGMDAHVGLEYGVSRAHQVLLSMQEAGYPFRTWEQIAMLYAGWDTDRSPTIQKRVLLKDTGKRHDLVADLWVARIKTTRTTQQAWACFLAYQDETLPPDRRIYHAMFEILIQDRKRLVLGSENIGHEAPHDGLRDLYPGDTIEVGSLPSSAHQLTYVRAEIPSIQQLYDHMREDDILPSDGILAMLLDSAESLVEGLTYLETSAHKNHIAANALLHASDDTQQLTLVSNSLFTSYVHLLCRFPHSTLQDHSGRVKWHYGTLIKSTFDLRQSLVQALYFLVKHRRSHLPAWNCVFKALARTSAPALGWSWRRLYLQSEESSKQEIKLHDKIMAFNLARQVTQTMKENHLDLDEDILMTICTITDHAASAARNVLQEYGPRQEYVSTVTQRLISDANIMLREGPAWLKRRLYALVEGANDTESPLVEPVEGTVELPRLLVTPRPAFLHIYIRALGLLRDFDGLEELVIWMFKYRVELAERRDMDRRGVILMRRALTALRVFLDDRWEVTSCQDNNDGFGASASAEQVARVAALVEQAEDWGDWPSDEEVEMYVEQGRNLD